MVILTSQRHLPLCKVNKGACSCLLTAAGIYHCGSHVWHYVQIYFQIGAFQSAAQLSTSAAFFFPIWPYKNKQTNKNQNRKQTKQKPNQNPKLAEILNPLSSHYFTSGNYYKRFSGFLVLLEITSLALLFWEWGFQLLKKKKKLLFPGDVDLFTSDCG